MRHVMKQLTFAAVALLASACAGGPSEPVSDADALRAAAELSRLADSLTTAGADADVANAYRSLALLARIGHPSSIVVTVDGTPTEYLAVAREIALQQTVPCPTPNGICPTAPPLRSMIAWERANPRRLVQLTATPGGLSIGTIVPGQSIGAFMNSATLTFFDGAGGVFVGTNGTQSISDAVQHDTPCFTTTFPTTMLTIAPGGTCRLADFTVSFTGTVAPPAFPVRNNSGSGTHTLAMATQPVSGSRYLLNVATCEFCTGLGYPPGYLPPINLNGNRLQSSLTAVVDASGVALTLTVYNLQSTPVEVRFNSGQRYDFRVFRRDGTTAWTWSADKGFTLALGAMTIPANDHVAWTERWSPAQSGSFVAVGTLTSSSHFSEAAAPFTVP